MKLSKRQYFFDFEQPNWDLDPELFCIHQLLDTREDIIHLARPCFPNAKDENRTVLGRDGMTLEQVVRSAIYLRYKRLTYVQLSIHSADSRLARTFLKMGLTERFSPQTLQENIIRISADSLEEIHLAICLYAIQLGVDDGKKLRPDSTVIKTNIHYPTNASLLWDSVRVSCALLKTCTALISEIRFRNYRKAGKRLCFKIVNTKGKGAEAKRRSLFKKLLRHHKACENQVTEALEVLKGCVMSDKTEEKKRQKLLQKLQDLLPKMQQVYNVAHRHEILGKVVPNEDKLFSLFEDHTDCIVKGSRDASFGHKVNFTAGASHLIFDCILKRGNPADTSLFEPALDNIEKNLNITPKSVAADGGFASIANLNYALSKNIQNVVFNKVRGALQNVASSTKMETMLKKWRSGIEAVISNFKRGLNAGTCIWKGWDAFLKFMRWNVITFNLRIIARFLIASMP